MLEDSELLRRYVLDGSESAFAELVRRHLDLVYSTAIRKVGGDSHLAEDVTQKVFTDLASKASSLRTHPVLSGWLFTSTHFAATQIVRSETRRRKREEKAQAMNEILHEIDSATDWERMRPLLDDLINELDPRDREAVCLRFFEGKTLRSVGERLKLTEDGARSRVDRALERLHGALARRGVTSTTGALAATLASQAGMSAPAGLASAVSAAALTGAATGTAAATAGTLTSIMSTTKSLVILSVALLGLGTAVYQTQTAEKMTADLLKAHHDLAAAQVEMALMRRQIHESVVSAAASKTKNEETVKTPEAVGRQEADTAIASADEIKRERLYQLQIESDKDFTAALIRTNISNSVNRHRAPNEDSMYGFRQDLSSAEKYFERDMFPIAVASLNLAFLQLPREVPIPEEAQMLQTRLQLQSKPAQVQFQSDGFTHVTIIGQQILGAFTDKTVSVPTGDYDLVGYRTGFADVTVKLHVVNSETPQPVPIVTVVCTEPAIHEGSLSN